MRYLTLKTEELYKNSTENMVRKRSHCLLLSHQKRTIIDLSKILDVSRRTIERWFDWWEMNGLKSLEMVPDRGVKTRLKGYEKEVAE
jgi:transposase